MRAIPLTRGKYALVDNADYERVSALTWSAVHTSGGYWYARHAWNRKGEWGHIKMHRFILDLPEDVLVDHKNGNALDNRRENLRIATHQQNVRNTRGYSKTGFKGVSAHVSGRFHAQIRDNDGRQRNLGIYDTVEDAARVYDAAAYLIDPEFNARNFTEIDDAAMEIAKHVINGGKPSDLFRRKHPNAKLTDEDVVAIRLRYRAGNVLMRDIAKEYGVCVAAVGHAISGRTFRHITTPPPIREDKRGRRAA